VTCVQRAVYTVACEGGEIGAEVSGRFAYEHPHQAQYPTVGDWVVAELGEYTDRALIHSVLPRKTWFSRQSVNPGGRGNRKDGGVGEQIIAANIDVVFVVAALDGGRNFNVARLERYVTVAWESGATPVVALNKADVCQEPEARKAEAEQAAPGVPIHVVSATRGDGLSELAAHVSVGVTAAFLGPSGVGKSSLINAIRGDASLATSAVRDGDLRGRHTTTHRELLFLPCRGMLIDTPGIRELQVWGTGEGLAQSFADIEELAEQCRFSDCRHDTEPGCAVLAAVEDGGISRDRLESYRKLNREYRHLELRSDPQARRHARQEQKRFAKLVRRMPKKRR
jgi:ribosome biogenesis GTPase